jgi:hypothetical protein
MKLLPETCTVAELPAATLPGERLVIAGTGLFTVKVSLLEVPPPFGGVNTVTAKVPLIARLLAGMSACNWVALINVVVRSAPFQRTTELDTKLLPLMVKVRPEEPTSVLEELREEIAGAGLLMAKLAELEAPPPGLGLKTVTAAVLAAAISVAGIDVSSRVLLIYVVVRLLLFQRTVELEMKPLPVTCKVKADPPTMVLPGDKLAIEGTGLDEGVFEEEQPAISDRNDNRKPERNRVKIGEGEILFIIYACWLLY